MPSLIVIGGGAAGFFCAVNAARMHPGLQVTLLEKTGKLLSKVRVSGGGRCNVTHGLFEIPELSRRYPRGQHFVKKSFHQFSTTDTIRWFQERGVQLKTEADGHMFPVTDSSETIAQCLLAEADHYGVEIVLHADISSFRRMENGFELTGLHSGKEKVFQADYICVATGGAPKASMLDWLQAAGHTVVEPVPSLFTFNLPQHPITELMGVSASPVRVKIEGSKLTEEGPVLITHWGLSGPAVLRLSAWGARELAAKNYQFRAHLNWLPDVKESELRQRLQSVRVDSPSKKLINFQVGSLPSRLWQFLLSQSGITEETRFADLPAKAENALIRNLSDYVVDVRGKTTFKEEFVTAGGVTLSDVDPNTMMSRKLPGLFFAGEVLDVDGITGGFNFQHAWTSGWIAARSLMSDE